MTSTHTFQWVITSIVDDMIFQSDTGTTNKQEQQGDRLEKFEWHIVQPSWASCVYEHAHLLKTILGDNQLQFNLSTGYLFIKQVQKGNCL